MNLFLNDSAADQAPTNHSHQMWRRGVIMRICDAGKHGSADLSPVICGLASGPNQIFFKRQFHNVPFNYFTNQGHGQIII